MRIGWVRTFTGLYVSLCNPTPEMICIQDMVHQLALEARWGGATSIPFSVAHHSIWVARFVRELLSPDLRELGTAHALIHDAHEAYAKDLPTPLKALLGDAYTRMTDGLDQAIREHLGLGPPSDEIYCAIKAGDSYAAWCEAKALLAECKEVKRAGTEPPEGIKNKLAMVPEVKRETEWKYVERAWTSFLQFSLKQCRT